MREGTNDGSNNQKLSFMPINSALMNMKDGRLVNGFTG